MSGRSTAKKVAEHLPNPLIRQFVALAEIVNSDSETPVVDLGVEGIVLVIYDQEQQFLSQVIDREWTMIPLIVHELAERTEYSREEIESYCEEPLQTDQSQIEFDMISDASGSGIDTEQIDEIGSQIKQRSFFDKFKGQAYEMYEESDEGLANLVRDAMALVIYDLCIDEMRLNIDEQKKYSKQLRQFVEEHTDLTWKYELSFDDEDEDGIDN